MLIDYMQCIGKPTSYITCKGNDDCSICKTMKGFRDIVALRDIKTKMLVHLSRQDYNIIQKIVSSLIKDGEKTGDFEKNGGFTWLDIPLTEAGKVATLSVRKTITDTEPKYEWMLVKDA